LNDERDNLPHNHPRVKEIAKLERAAVERGWKIRGEVFALEAHTAEGTQAKARMVLRDLEEEAGHGSQSCNRTLLAAVSLARDILGEGLSHGEDRTIAHDFCRRPDQ
jgi:hypothetical protein